MTTSDADRDIRKMGRLKRRWEERQPETRPGLNSHRWVATEDGRITWKEQARTAEDTRK